jgi:diaminopimelate epimerase
LPWDEILLNDGAMRSHLDGIHLAKYHSLGNDYLFLDETQFPLPTAAVIEKICHRNFGIGANGLLYGGREVDGAFTLSIINSDGGGAEISGNGTRILARALFDLGRVTGGEVEIRTPKKSVRCEILSDGTVAVNMGQPAFEDRHIPTVGEIPLTHVIDGIPYAYHAVSFGNPHCVVFVEELFESRRAMESVGEVLEYNPLFPERTNVEFAKIDGRHAMAVDVWERGSGHTLSSGSGSCAAFAVANRLGMCADAVRVHMGGGILSVSLSPSGDVIQWARAEKTCTCHVPWEFLSEPWAPPGISRSIGEGRTDGMWAEQSGLPWGYDGLP